MLATLLMGVGSPPPAAFVPTDLGATLKLWLDPTSGVTHAPDVSAWVDRSSSVNSCAQSTGLLQPAYTASGLNSLPMVSPLVGTQWLSSSTNLFATGSPRTLFAVWTNGTAAGAQPGRILAITTGAGSWIMSAFTFGGRTSVYTDVTTNIQSIPLIDYTLPTLLMVSWDGNTAHNVVCKVNGVSATVINGAGSATPNEAGSAGYGFGDGASGMTADRGDLIVCDTVLDATNTGKVETYLMTKWGL